MNIKYLEFFEAVAEYGSINRAARAMYVSQPHLSHIIREMEEEVGAPLIRRLQRGVVLTAVGEQYLEHCRNILREMDHISRLSENPESGVRRLSVAATRFTETAECFTQVCRKHEGSTRFSFRMEEDSTFGVVSQVEQGEADIGVLHFAASELETMKHRFRKKNLSWQHLADLHPCIAVSSEHELIRQGRPVTLENVLPYGFIRYTGQYEDFLYRLSIKGHRVDLNEYARTISVNDREAQLRLLEKTNCFTIGITAFEQQEERYHVVCVPVTESLDMISFGTVVLSGPDRKHRPSQIEREFTELLREHFSRLEARDRAAAEPEARLP